MTDQAAHLRSLVKPPAPAAPAVSYGPVCPAGVHAGAAPTHLRSRSGTLTNRHQRLAGVVSRFDPQELVDDTREPTSLRSQPARLARAIAICSGKGGVGKSNVAVNLAAAMSAMGLKVVLLDADLGLANADVLCNLSPRVTLEHVASGGARLTDAMLLAPGGFRLIPGASGVSRLADMDRRQRQGLLEQLSALEHVADVLLIDCGAGIGANVLGFAAAASTVLVTLTPEPTAMTDGYSTLKSLLARTKGSTPAQHQSWVRNNPPGAPLEASPLDIRVVVNMAHDEREGLAAFERINHVSRLFLKRSLRYGGTIPTDPAVPAAVRARMPFVLHAPDAEATGAVRRLAAELARSRDGGSHVGAGMSQGPDSSRTASAGFFSRLAVWMGIAEYAE